jgi:hypothetical protein
MCPITNILQPENMLDYYSPDTLSDFSQAYENKKGVSLSLKQIASVRAYFSAPVAISTVSLQPVYGNRATNIVKFSVFYITLDDKPYINPKTGKLLNYTTNNNDNSLTIPHDMINNLKGLNLTILETSGGRPSWFRLRILGCYKSSKSSIRLDPRGKLIR